MANSLNMYTCLTLVLFWCCPQLSVNTMPSRFDTQLMNDLRELFQKKRCPCVTLNPSFADLHLQKKTWVLELNSWTSQQLSTTIAAILMRDFLGYHVDLNPIPPDATTLKDLVRRLRRTDLESLENGSDGPAIDEMLEAKEDFGYANLEVWSSIIEEHFFYEGLRDGSVRNFGPVGYKGRSGWYVSKAFTERPEFSVTPAFYGAYDSSDVRNQPLLTALKEYRSVDCNAANVCIGVGNMSCWRELIETGDWCPSREGVLPAILGVAPGFQVKTGERIAVSHGFQFALRYLPPDEFLPESVKAFETGAAQIVYTWLPSLFLASLRMRGIRVVRIMLPDDDCSVEENQDCDFPTNVLRKLSSNQTDRDTRAREFFDSFRLEASHAGVNHTLIGAGMRELMVALAKIVTHGDSFRAATADEIFDVACDWICSNQHEGAHWTKWVKSRNVPFFADTCSAWYPWPTFLALILVSLAYIAFMELPWLNTTLNPFTIRRILAKNESSDCNWRTRLESRLWTNREKACTETGGSDSSSSSESDIEDAGVEAGTGDDSPQLTALMPEGYWLGLRERALMRDHLRCFWPKVDKQIAEMQTWRQLPERAWPENKDLVSFARTTFSCFRSSKTVNIFLTRSAAGVASGRPLLVDVSIEECDGGAKDGTDFHAENRSVSFPPGMDQVVVQVPILQQDGIWYNFRWFRARLAAVNDGEAALAHPAEASILVLEDVGWPANICSERRLSSAGITLLRYFIRADRLRRGEKWTKTMVAMLWLPIHTVVISTLVQKMLVDQVADMINKDAGSEDVIWYYWQAVLLVLIQLISVGLHRWADVVQTRQRGRTGGIRQVHRAELLHKVLYMEQSEHWEASDSHWLYSTIYDVDVLTADAYFQVFVMFQSCFALLLSLAMIIYLQRASLFSLKAFHGKLAPLFTLMCFMPIPFGFIGVWTRRKLTWMVVIARKNAEMAWFKSCTWTVTHGKSLFGYTPSERTALEKRMSKQNSEFVSNHWDARDTMNDNAWLTLWSTGIGYCFILLFGIFALIDRQTYDIGHMEVGSFYAICSIYLKVGKYSGSLSHVFVSFQKAVVSLREVAAFFNQKDQRSQRWELKNGMRQTSRDSSVAIRLDAGLCFRRPHDNRVGSNFAELKLRYGCNLPLGRFIHVSSDASERVLRSFLGLTARVIHPTGPAGEELPRGGPSVAIPSGLRTLMISAVPVTLDVTSLSVKQQLEFTGAPLSLCSALAEAVGLELERQTASLGPGASQVFSIIRALLLDPDVLAAYRPLSLVPLDSRPHIAKLLRIWQACGGLPAIAEFLGETIPAKAPPVVRNPERTIIFGNSKEGFEEASGLDVHVDLDSLLWKS